MKNIYTNNIETYKDFYQLGIHVYYNIVSDDDLARLYAYEIYHLWPRGH